MINIMYKIVLFTIYLKIKYHRGQFDTEADEDKYLAIDTFGSY
jgi:hypothetical protein